MWDIVTVHTLTSAAQWEKNTNAEQLLDRVAKMYQLYCGFKGSKQDHSLDDVHVKILAQYVYGFESKNESAVRKFEQMCRSP